MNKILEFFTIFARKMPEFYIRIAQKNFSRIFFLGGGMPPVSYAYGWQRMTSLSRTASYEPDCREIVKQPENAVVISDELCTQ